MNHIQKISQRFLIVLKFLLVSLPLLLVLKWIFIKSPIVHFLMLGGWAHLPFPEAIWTPSSQFIGFISQFIELIPVLISLLALINVFDNYKRGEIFNSDNAKYFRVIGWMFILSGLVTQIVGQGIWTVANTINNPPGERMISVGFGSPNLEALLCGAVVIVISWVMLEASKLHDDQRYTV